MYQILELYNLKYTPEKEMADQEAVQTVLGQEDRKTLKV